MKTYTAEQVFSRMTPSALVDFFVSNLPDDSGRIEAELGKLAYRALVVNVGQKEADEMLEEKES